MIVILRPAALALVFAWTTITSAVAAELVMVERRGCVWCARFDAEVGAVYARTAEAGRAPLRRVDLDASGAREPWLAAPVRYTPTFVLVQDGRERGRITGYPGEAAFWGLPGGLLAGSPAPGPAAVGVRLP